MAVGFGFSLDRSQMASAARSAATVLSAVAHGKKQQYHLILLAEASFHILENSGGFCWGRRLRACKWLTLQSSALHSSSRPAVGLNFLERRA